MERLIDKFHIKREHLEKAELFFSRHGGKAVFFGRSVSYLRVLTAILAGVSQMHYPRFLMFNALGGITWAALFGMAGYHFGKHLAAFRSVVHEIALGILIVAAIGGAIYFIKKSDRIQKGK